MKYSTALISAVFVVSSRLFAVSFSPIAMFIKSSWVPTTNAMFAHQRTRTSIDRSILAQATKLADDNVSSRLEEYSGLFTLKNQQQSGSNVKQISASEMTAYDKKNFLVMMNDYRKLNDFILEFEDSEQVDMMDDKQAVLEELISNASRHAETTYGDLFSSNSFSEIYGNLKIDLQSLVKRSTFSCRCIDKPRGYAGDFQTIDMIYDNKPEGIGIVGKTIDRFSLNLVAAQAVRNRRSILADEINSLLLKHPDASMPLKVTSLACGPARELQDVFLNSSGEFPNINCHLVDHDKGALDVAKDWMEMIPDFPHDNISLYQKNLLHLMSRKESFDVAPQDFIYSAGLIDYFKDGTIVRFLNFAYDNLRAGGKVMVGNFHESNPSRGWMDTVFEWRLIHRKEENMKDLFLKSKFAKNCEIVFDETGVQMMAACYKD